MEICSAFNRMKTKFFTCLGDKGRSRIGKKNLLKSDLVFELLGDLDELNSWLGFCRAELHENRKEKQELNLVVFIREVQEALFIIQAQVAVLVFNLGKGPNITKEKVLALEKIIVLLDRKLPPLKNFVIPGASSLGSILDYARALARRAERQAVKFNQVKKLPPEILEFLNRLSSFFFALSRYVNFIYGSDEEKPRY